MSLRDYQFSILQTLTYTNRYGSVLAEGTVCWLWTCVDMGRLDGRLRSLKSVCNQGLCGSSECGTTIARYRGFTALVDSLGDQMYVLARASVNISRTVPRIWISPSSRTRKWCVWGRTDAVLMDGHFLLL